MNNESKIREKIVHCRTKSWSFEKYGIKKMPNVFETKSLLICTT